MEKRETSQDRYHKAHTISLTIRLMKNTEQDIIQKLEDVPNKAGYIKSLIRADIAKEAGLDNTPVLNWIGAFDKYQLKLRNIYNNVNNAEIKGTKSFAGIRQLDIPAECVEFFKNYINDLSSLYLFCKLDGSPITKSSYDKMWRQILKKMNAAVITDSEKQLGITPISITAHYFRHNYCTLLYYSGLSLGKAVELMGHADYRMIMNIYKHLDEENRKN